MNLAQKLLLWRFISHEEGDGRITRDPDDPGGTTRYGFAQRYNPDIDVTTLTAATAEARFWATRYQPTKLLDALPAPVAFCIVDGAFLMGGDAIKHFQISASAAMDGVLGDRTVNAITHHWLTRGFELVDDALFLRVEKHMLGQAKYRRGWVRRVLRLRAACAAKEMLE